MRLRVSILCCLVGFRFLCRVLLIGVFVSVVGGSWRVSCDRSSGGASALAFRDQGVLANTTEQRVKVVILGGCPGAELEEPEQNRAGQAAGKERQVGELEGRADGAGGRGRGPKQVFAQRHEVLKVLRAGGAPLLDVLVDLGLQAQRGCAGGAAAGSHRGKQRGAQATHGWAQEGQCADDEGLLVGGGEGPREVRRRVLVAGGGVWWWCWLSSVHWCLWCGSPQLLLTNWWWWWWWNSPWWLLGCCWWWWWWWRRRDCCRDELLQLQQLLRGEAEGWWRCCRGCLLQLQYLLLGDVLLILLVVLLVLLVQLVLSSLVCHCVSWVS